MVWQSPLGWPLELPHLHHAHSNNTPQKRPQSLVSRLQSTETQGRRRSRPLSLVSIQEEPVFDSSMPVPQLPPLDFSVTVPFQDCQSFVQRRPESCGFYAESFWNQSFIPEPPVPSHRPSVSTHSSPAPTRRPSISTQQPPVPTPRPVPSAKPLASRHSCFVQSLPFYQDQYSEHLFPYGHTARKSWSPLVFEQQQRNYRHSVYSIRSNYSYSDTMRHSSLARQQQPFSPADMLPKDQAKEVSLESLLLALGLCSPYQPLPPRSLPSMTRRSAGRFVAGTATRPVPPPPPPPPPPPRPKAVLEILPPDAQHPPKPPVCMFGPPPMQRSTEFDEYLAQRAAGQRSAAPETMDRLKFIPPSALKRLCVSPSAAAPPRLRFFPPDPFRRLCRIDPDLVQAGLSAVDAAHVGFEFFSAADLVAEPWWVTKRKNKAERERLRRQQELQAEEQRQMTHGRQSIREKVKKTLLTRFKIKIRGL